jgi:hypothetical protein
MAKRNPEQTNKPAEVEQSPAPAADPAPAPGSRPVCKDHGPMTEYSKKGIIAYYRCKVKGCRASAKRLRPIGPIKNLYGFGKSAGRAKP